MIANDAALITFTSHNSENPANTIDVSTCNFSGTYEHQTDLNTKGNFVFTA